MLYSNNLTIRVFIKSFSRSSLAKQKDRLNIQFSAICSEFDTAVAIVYLVYFFACKVPNLMQLYSRETSFNNIYLSARVAINYNTKRIIEISNTIQTIQGSHIGQFVITNVVAPTCAAALMSHTLVTAIAYCVCCVQRNKLSLFAALAIYRRLIKACTRKDSFLNTTNQVTIKLAINSFYTNIGTQINKAGNNKIKEIAAKHNALDTCTSSNSYKKVNFYSFNSLLYAF